MKSGIVYTSVLIALSALLSTPTYGQCHKHQLHLLSGTLSTSASRQTGSGLFANTDTHTHKMVDNATIFRPISQR